MMQLTIEETDFDQSVRGQMTALSRGEVVLGDMDAQNRVVLEALPGVIAERIRRMLPDGFGVASLEFSFELSGKVFGLGLAGQVTVQLEPVK